MAVAGSELSLRVASAVVLGSFALAATLLGGWAFALLWLAAAIAFASEWIAMSGGRPRTRLTLIAAVGLVALVLGCRGVLSAPVAGALLLAAGVAQAILAQGAGARLWSLAGLLYAGFVAAVPVLVRDRPDLGAAAILWIFAVVWTTDVAAYFTGRALGGPKLMPRVSPKKTWSGFAGGLVGGTLAGLAIVVAASRLGAPLPVGMVAALALSGLASVACQVGDLAESAMKRRFAVKDSGRLIPGHGGVMDRLDGFAAVLVLIGAALAGARFGGWATT